MADQRYSIDTDLKEAAAMAQSLLPYVHEDALYGQAGSGGFFSKLPSLTVGALVMRLRRLEALRPTMTAAQTRHLDEIVARDAQVRRDWRVHYEAKMQREVQSRLNAMAAFFEECSANPRACAANYGPEASRRTIVQELLIVLRDTDTPPSDDVQAHVAGVDSRLRRVVQPSDFVWDAALVEVYPRAEFWWLYHRPQAQ